MQITAQQLMDVFGIPKARAEKWSPLVTWACRCFEINSPLRIAAFVAQVGHESGRLRYVKEIWGPMPWQQRYEGRIDLGNTEPGDGKRFMGRGLIQLTGRNNYTAASRALGIDFVNAPHLLEQPGLVAMSAAWFWDQHALNDLADVGDMRRITRIINGGYNGLEERMAFYEKALACLQASAQKAAGEQADEL